MKNEQKRSSLPELMALTVFTVFALCILLVLLSGGKAYRRLTERDRESFDRRTACQYLATRVRQADSHGGITVEEFCGQDALVIREQIHGQTYLTRIYCYDGMLRELYTPASGDFSLEDGDPLLEVSSLQLSASRGTLLAQLEFPDSSNRQLMLRLRSGGGAP